MNNQYSPSGFSFLPVVVKNLLIIIIIIAQRFYCLNDLVNCLQRFFHFIFRVRKRLQHSNPR